VRLNHIGIVVHNVLETAGVLCSLGLVQLTKPEPDPIQKVTACFLAAGGLHDVHLELLQPTDESSPIANFLITRGAGLHHLCFEVEDIEEMTSTLERRGLRVVSPPVECIGYDRSFNLKGDRPTKISFLLLGNTLLIELLRKGA
jgi:methylmalonyl-CoA/ethylmalonyl-CoA epimerase